MNPLWESLVAHLNAQGAKEPDKLAKEILVKQGSMKEDGSLTTKGKQRVKLGPAGRAKDRAAKLTGKKPQDFVYDAKKKKAVLKRD
jgi:hypothetical protein